jgi:hypothetical protein
VATLLRGVEDQKYLARNRTRVCPTKLISYYSLPSLGLGRCSRELFSVCLSYNMYKPVEASGLSPPS